MTIVTKRCGHCREVLPTHLFHWKEKNKGKRTNKCIDCTSQYDKLYYEKNKTKKIANKNLHREYNNYYNTVKTFEYLFDHPCVDCGETDPVVLQFDHRDPSSKTNCVSQMRPFYKWNRIQEEIDKCDVRCANCHTRKTAKQCNWYKILDQPAPVNPMEKQK